MKSLPTVWSPVMLASNPPYVAGTARSVRARSLVPQFVSSHGVALLLDGEADVGTRSTGAPGLTAPGVDSPYEHHGQDQEVARGRKEDLTPLLTLSGAE
jgi:nucleoid-associated protein YgaU